MSSTWKSGGAIRRWGLNLYVASGITKMGITELAIAVRQWLLKMLVFLVVVTYWPALSIWVPKTLGMM